MATELLDLWLPLISGCVALLAGMVTAFWAYTKFVLEKGLLPPTRFEVGCKVVGTHGDKKVLEILLHVKNEGRSPLVINDLRLDLLYLDNGHAASGFNNPLDARFGRLNFLGSVRRDLEGRTPESSTPASPSVERGGRGFSVLSYDTFVQAGIDQEYAFPAAVPVGAKFILVWASFRYAVRPTRLQRCWFWLGRRLGLIQFSLSHANQPHTTERVFPI